MGKSMPTKSLEEIAQDTCYSPEAFYFVREGLQYTIRIVHGRSGGKGEQMHVTGRDLCWGMRELAVQRWGLMAPTVLRHWNITSTLDFGKIVFAMIEHGWMMKNERDRLEDFSNVYDIDKMCELDFKLGDEQDP